MLFSNRSASIKVFFKLQLKINLGEKELKSSGDGSMENGHIAQTQWLVIEIVNQPVSVRECLPAPELRQKYTYYN